MRDQEIVGLWEAYSSIYESPDSDVVNENLQDTVRGALNKGVEIGKKIEKNPVLGPLMSIMKPVGSGKDRGPVTSTHRNVASRQEQFETWVNDLVEEGYDLSDYTWNDMYEMFMNLDEEAPKRITKSSKNPRLMKGAGPARLHNPSPKKVEEQTDLFDYILEHLIAEGYADTNDAALSIMANMSEEWKQSILEADSLAAQQARREKRLAAQRKREGRPSGGGDFGHHYGKPRAQADAEREERMRKFINKEESIVGDLLDEGEKPFPDEKVKAKQAALRSQGGNALERRMKMGLARRRAKEAQRTGGSQQSAGAGWYHGR